MRTFNALWALYHQDYEGNWRYDVDIAVEGVSIPSENIMKKSWSGGMTLTGFDIGIVPAQKFTFTVRTDSFVMKQNQKVSVQVRAVGDMGETPYYPYGTYFTDKIIRKNDQYTIECLDRIKRTGSKGANLSGYTMAAAFEHIAALLGCAADASGIAYDIGNIDTAKYTLRELLSFIASANGGNILIDFTDTMRLVKLTLGTPVMRIGTGNARSTTEKEDAYYPSTIMIRASQSEEEEDPNIIVGDSDGDDAYVIDNPFGTRTMANQLLAQLQSYHYKPCQIMTAFIDPALEIGDTVEVRGKITQVWNWNISSNMSVSFSAPSNYNRYDKYEFKGTLTEKVEQVEQAVNEVQTVVLNSLTGSRGLVFVDHPPTLEEINSYPADNAVAVYDANNPYAPAPAGGEETPVVKNILYPVTHVYYVKTFEPEPSWLDTFDGKILECYNYPRFAPDFIPSGIHPTSVNMHATQIYVAINFESITDDMGSWYYITNDSGGRWLQACDATGDIGYDDSIEDMWFGIGQPRYTIHSDGSGGPPVGTSRPVDKVLTTLSFSNPTANTHWGTGGFSGNFIPVGTRKKDLVVWIYDYEFHMDGQPTVKFDPDTELDRYDSSVRYGINDDLFYEEQRGYRIISNQWKYAPWERYPHLLQS